MHDGESICPRSIRLPYACRANRREAALPLLLSILQEGGRPKERPELLFAVVHDDECQPTWATAGNDKPGVRRLGIEGMGRSYRPTAYLDFGRVYFNLAVSDAPEPLSPFTECAVGSFDMSDGHQKAPRPTWLLDRGCPDSLFAITARHGQPTLST